MATIVSRFGFDVARAASLEPLLRGRSVLVIGVGDGGALEVALARGATRVAGIDIDGQAVAVVRARLGERAALRHGPLREATALGAPFDVVLVRRGETMVARDLWREASRLVRAGGWLVAAALAGDRNDAPPGAMGYSTLREHLAAYFPHVTMLAQATFAAAVLIPFGDLEVEPLLDSAFAPVRRPELYVAVAGPEPLALPFAIVELPDPLLDRPAASPVPAAPDAEPARSQAAPAERDAEPARSQAAPAERDMERARSQAAPAERDAEPARSQTVPAERDAEPARSQAAPAAPNAESALVVELRERVAAAERSLAGAREAALAHAAEMRSAEAALGERDAYVAELEREVRSAEVLRTAARKAAQHAEAVEARERLARLRVAELEGTLVRLGAPAPASGVAAGPPPDRSERSHEAEELHQRIVELEARCEQLTARTADAEREAWGHLRARSEAEAAAAEVREDTVRKLKDARKLANVELMRAMEEATRKAVTLKEELLRSERERKEAVAAAARLSTPSDSLGGAITEVAARLRTLERAVAAEGARAAAIESALRAAIHAAAADEQD